MLNMYFNPDLQEENVAQVSKTKGSNAKSPKTPTSNNIRFKFDRDPKGRLTLILLVANLANTKSCIKFKNLLKPCHMGTYLRVLSESYPMNTNMTGFRWFSKIFAK